MCFKIASRGNSPWLFAGRGEDLLFMAHIAIKTFATESWSPIHMDPFQMLNPCCPAPLFFNLEPLLEVCLCLMVLQTRNVFQLVKHSLPQESCMCVWVGVKLPLFESSAFDVYLTPIAPCVEQRKMLPLLRNALCCWHKRVHFPPKQHPCS